MERWAGKIAVVTGASSGIGEAVAIDLVKAGLKVVGLARRIDRMKLLQEQLKSERGELYPYHCDVANNESVKAAFAWIDKKFNGVNILVNNAGKHVNSSYVLSEEDNFSELKNVIDVNLLGLVSCTQEAYRLMKKTDDYGHIVNINSVAGHRIPVIQNVTLNVYPASKHAVTALTEVIRQELNSLGNTKIRISDISPGGVRTELLGVEFYKKETGRPRLTSKDVSNAVLYVIGVPSTVQIHELIIKPVGEPI